MHYAGNSEPVLAKSRGNMTSALQEGYHMLHGLWVWGPEVPPAPISNPRALVGIFARLDAHDTVGWTEAVGVIILAQGNYIAED